MTDTQTPTRGFRRGAEQAKASNDFASTRPGFFSIKDGEVAFVQFVTDPWEWITVDMHSQVQTKQQPQDWEGTWPRNVTPMCRLNKMEDGLPLHGDCYVCENLKSKGKNDQPVPFKKTSRTWALGVLRQEVTKDGRRQGFKNKMKEYSILDAEGKTTSNTEMRPEVVIFTQGWKNFFAAVSGAAQAYGGSITNLTFAIKREGEMLDTSYSVTPLGATKQDWNQPEYASKLGISVDWDNRDADGHPTKTYPGWLDLETMVLHRASDDFYGRFIDPRVTVPSGKKADASKPVNEVEPEALQNMRERIMGHGAATEAQGAPPAAPEQPQAPQQAPQAAAAPAPAQAESDYDEVSGGGGDGLEDFDEA